MKNNKGFDRDVRTTFPEQSSKIIRPSYLDVVEDIRGRGTVTPNLFGGDGILANVAFSAAGGIAEGLKPIIDTAGPSVLSGGMEIASRGAVESILVNSGQQEPIFSLNMASNILSKTGSALGDLSTELSAAIKYDEGAYSPTIRDAAARVVESLSGSDGIEWEVQKLKDSLNMINVHVGLVLILKDYILDRKGQYDLTKEEDVKKYTIWLYDLLFNKSLKEFIQESILPNDYVENIIEKYEIENVKVEYEEDDEELYCNMKPESLSLIIRQFSFMYCREEVNCIKLLGEVKDILGLNYIDFLSFSMDRFYSLPENEELQEARKRYRQNNLIDPFFVFFVVFRKKSWEELLIPPDGYSPVNAFNRRRLIATKKAVSDHTRNLTEMSENINNIMKDRNKRQWSCFIKCFIKKVTNKDSNVVLRNVNPNEIKAISKIGYSIESEIIDFEDIPNSLALHITVILMFEIFNLGGELGGLNVLSRNRFRKILNSEKEGTKNFVEKISRSNLRYSLSLEGLFVTEDELNTTNMQEYRKFISESGAGSIVSGLRSKMYTENLVRFPDIIKLHCYFLEAFSMVPLLATSEVRSERNLQCWDGTSFNEAMIVQLNGFIPSVKSGLLPQQVIDSFLSTFYRFAGGNRWRNGHLEYTLPYHDSFFLVFVTILPWVMADRPTSKPPEYGNVFRVMGIMTRGKD